MTSVDAFNAESADAAAELIRPCCAAKAWTAAVVADRPYPDLAALCAASDTILAELDWSDVEEALAGHPRIGDRTRAGSLSRQEQSGVAGADEAVRTALAEGNAEYERRFGHVYLVFASGRSAEELLAVLRDRLENTVDVERGVVRGELAAITRLRLTGALG